MSRIMKDGAKGKKKMSRKKNVMKRGEGLENTKNKKKTNTMKKKNKKPKMMSFRNVILEIKKKI